RRSTTRTGIRPATRSCWSSPAASAPASGRWTWRSAGAARSSWCCCPRPTPVAPPRWRAGSGRPCATPRWWSCPAARPRNAASTSRSPSASPSFPTTPAPRRGSWTPPTTRCTPPRRRGGTRTGWRRRCTAARSPRSWRSAAPPGPRTTTFPAPAAAAPPSNGPARPAPASGPARRNGPVGHRVATLRVGPARRSRPDSPAADSLAYMPPSHSTGRRATRAVIPAAGLATRFLPATKTVPKELFPVVDRPVLHYIVEEAAAAGITDVLLITGRGKVSMVDYFDRRPDLEEKLRDKGDEELLAAVRRPAELAAIYTRRQQEIKG